MKKKKFYLTTPIYYVNDVPHIGHSYSTIVADVLARYHREQGNRVFFLAGTDENAQKNVESALKIHPERATSTRTIVRDYVNTMSKKWQETWKKLDISNDDFIRTTEERHTKAVEKFWAACLARKDIYKATYDGLYCVGCEGYVTESDLVDGLCPHHKRKPEKLSEENYFFRLSRYKKRILEHIKKHPEFIQPASRRNEIVAFLRDHTNDFSVSRKNLEWGIPVPGDSSQTVYVWFDALINYISAIGYGADEKRFKNLWPADVHIVGKDIIKFHCVYWPAMLMSAGLPLPKTVFAHGFFTIDGQKISKSLGNVIDPLVIVKKYGNDTLRYYLLREITFGEDGDFSFDRLQKRYETDLANNLGNLLMRVITLSVKGGYGSPPKRVTMAHPKRMNKIWLAYHKAMQNFAFHTALDVVWNYIATANKRLTDEKPWENLAFKKSETCVGEILAELFHVAHLIAPFMPETSEKMLKQIKNLKTEPLFPRL